MDLLPQSALQFGAPVHCSVELSDKTRFISSAPNQKSSTCLHAACQSATFRASFKGCSLHETAFVFSPKAVKSSSYSGHTIYFMVEKVIDIACKVTRATFQAQWCHILVRVVLSVVKLTADTCNRRTVYLKFSHPCNHLFSPASP